MEYTKESRIGWWIWKRRSIRTRRRVRGYRMVMPEINVLSPRSVSHISPFAMR